MLTRFFFVGIFVLAGAVSGPAQSELEVKAVVPTGFRSSGGSRQLVYTRRFVGSVMRVRIEARIDESAAKDAATFLATEKREGETAREDQAAAVALAGRPGRTVVYEGPLATPRGTVSSRRRVHAAKIDDRHFVRVEVMLAGLEGLIPDEVVRAAATGEAETLAALRVGGAATAEPVTEAEPTTGAAASSTRQLQYRNDAVLPLSFEVPAGWYLIEDANQAPGHLWVLATPDAEQARNGDRSQLGTALRLSATGFEPLLVGAEDAILRAQAFVEHELQTRHPGGPVSLVPRGEALLGNVKARIYGLQRDEDLPPLNGRLLIAATDSSVVIAEYVYLGNIDVEKEERADRLLASLRFDVDRSVREPVRAQILFDPPMGFTLTEHATDDSSRAWSMVHEDGTELVLRATALDVGSDLETDAAALRAAARTYFVDELGRLDAERIATARIAALPSGGQRLHAYEIVDDAFVDLYLIATARALIAVHLVSPLGAQSRSAGSALSTLRSIRGLDAPRFLDTAPQLESDGAWMKTHGCLSGPLMPFDVHGLFRPARFRIELDAAGTARRDGIRIAPSFRARGFDLESEGETEGFDEIAPGLVRNAAGELLAVLPNWR